MSDKVVCEGCPDKDLAHDSYSTIVKLPTHAPNADDNESVNKNS